MRKFILFFILFLLVISITKSANACSISLNDTFYFGLKSSKVRELQTCLNTKGYNVGKIDGIFYKKTSLALNKFKKDNAGYHFAKNAKDFKKYLNNNNNYTRSLGGDGLSIPSIALNTQAESSSSTQKVSNDRFSSTNVQVSGIDEPDIIKTDGNSLFMSKPSYWYGIYDRVMPAIEPTDIQVSKPSFAPPIFQNIPKTQIISVNPLSDMQLKSESIDTSGEMLLIKESNTLVVFSGQNINAYNVLDSKNPTKKWNLKLEDNTYLLTSRQKGNEIYLVTSTYINYETPCPFVPILENNNKSLFIPCERILLPNNISSVSQIYTLMKVNAKDGSVLSKTSIAENGYGAIVSMFENNLYLATEWNGEYTRDLHRTKIARISTSSMRVEASGSIPGRLLNQFAMDEHSGHLRVATTVGDNFGNKSVNDVYVLDMNLNTKGSIKDLGITERIYSVRFMGDVGYLVTFRQIDPFYVLDLKNPAKPFVAGELKIPGYSSYLEDLGKGIVLGIGRESGDLKLSLFDVRNPKNPTEVSKYILENNYSEAEYNHRAFLRDSQHDLFFIPGSGGGYIFSYKNNEIILKKSIAGNNTKRAIYVGNYMYIISDDMITVVDENSFEVVKTFEIK